MRIGLFLIDGFALMSYASFVEPLRAANLLAGYEAYDLVHVSLFGTREISSGGAEIRAQIAVGESVDFDRVCVFAGGDPFRFQDERTRQWLQVLARRRVQLVGISGGPVILANADVMSGYRMTVHWEHLEFLADQRPDLLLERTLYIIDRERITCAGGIAPLDLMHSLISADVGSDLAQEVSNWFMHTHIRPAGGPQRAGLTERYGVTSPAMIAAIEAMENHIADPLDMDQVALLAGVGKRQLNRLFQQHLKHTTMAFYRNMRLNIGRDLLRDSTLSIAQIANVTGFSSASHFSQCFHDSFELAPIRFRQNVHAGSDDNR